jgi:ABC-type taurine transport system ATPase subunit
MLSQEDFDGIGKAVAEALRGTVAGADTSITIGPACRTCGKPTALNVYAAIGASAHACPVCDKAKIDADRAKGVK